MPGCDNRFISWLTSGHFRVASAPQTRDHEPYAPAHSAPPARRRIRCCRTVRPGRGRLLVVVLVLFFVARLRVGGGGDLLRLGAGLLPGRHGETPPVLVPGLRLR